MEGLHIKDPNSLVLASLYHQAESPWATQAKDGQVHFRLRAARGCLHSVRMLVGDPFAWKPPKGPVTSWTWQHDLVQLQKTSRGQLHDYWETSWKPPYKRVRYCFVVAVTEAVGSEHHEGLEHKVQTPSIVREYLFGEEGLRPLSSGKEGMELELVPEPWSGFTLAYLHEGESFAAPSWASATIWYQIFPERYYRPGKTLPKEDLQLLDWHYGPVTNKEHYGGTLAGIREKLNHIASLGFTGLYLTPIFASPSVHKYDTSDYYQIDPAFGTKEDLHALVADCHARGIRVMLDAVFNHAGRFFAPWQDVLKNGAASPYATWFHIHSFPLFPEGKDSGSTLDANFESFAFTTAMPKLRTSNPLVRDYLISLAEYYIETFDIDGWRLDVANEVDHEFWREFRKRVRAKGALQKKEIYIVGEVWHNPNAWLDASQFDAVMDYKPGGALCDFLTGKLGAAECAERLMDLGTRFGSLARQVSFVLHDSHDTQRLLRRLTTSSGNPQKALALSRIAWTLLMLAPGSPCVYYGTEFGMDGGGDPDNRRCMVWNPDSDALEQADFFRRLIQLRKSLTAFIASACLDWAEAADGELLVQSLTNASRTVVVFANRAEPSLQRPSLPPGARQLLSSGKARSENIDGLSCEVWDFPAGS